MGIYEQLSSLDNVSINYSAGGAINIILALVMYGVALGIQPSQFKKVFAQPKSIILGLCGQWILLPALTYLIIVIFNKYIPPMVAMGMILVASCPGGNISNFMTSFSKGNIELSVSMTAVSTCMAPIITPGNYAIWGSLYKTFLCNHEIVDANTWLTIPFWNVFETVFILLGIPLVLGLLTTRFLPKVAKVLSTPLRYVSIVIFVAMVLVMFWSNRQQFVDYIKYIFIIVLVHNALALATGNTVARLGHLPVRDRRALTIEVGIQNSGLGLLLLFNPNIFPQEGIGGMLFVTAWWGVWHIVSGLTVATIFRKSKITSSPFDGSSVAKAA